MWKQRFVLFLYIFSTQEFDKVALFIMIVLSFVFKFTQFVDR